VGSKKVADGGVVKLLTVIGLESVNGATELGGDIGVESGEGLGDIEFLTEREHPYKVRKII
jgi:hypothetical protein